MLKKNIAIAAVIGVAATVLLSVAVLVVKHFMPAGDLGRDAFRDKFAVELVLPKGTGSIRTVEFYPDMRTRKFAVEDHADGTTTHYNYRPDGSLSSAVVYGKVEENVKVRPVIRKAVMEADGATYQTDTEYSISGQVTKLVVLQPDGTTTRRYFHPNGRLAKDQLMERDGSKWKLMSELAFQPDGSKERVLVVTKGVEAIDTLYGPGEVVRALRTSDLKYGNYKEVWFDTDGKTPIRLVEQNSNRTEIVVKRKDGSVSERYLWYGNIANGNLTVYVMDKASKKRLEQTLYFIEGKLRLRSVEVYLADGRRTDLVLFRTHGPEAGTVESRVIFDGANFSEPHTRYEYRTDNTLETVKKQRDNSTTISEQKFTAQQNIKPDINPEWTTIRKVDLPPQVIEYVENREM